MEPWTIQMNRPKIMDIRGEEVSGMPDLDKMLKALKHHKETIVCNGCPYAEDDDTAEGNCPIYDDAIVLLRDLLREQEQEPISKEGIPFCGECRTAMSKTQDYCHKCGKKVKWING